MHALLWCALRWRNWEKITLMMSEWCHQGYLSLGLKTINYMVSRQGLMKGGIVAQLRGFFAFRPSCINAPEEKSAYLPLQFTAAGTVTVTAKPNDSLVNEGPSLARWCGRTMMEQRQFVCSAHWWFWQSVNILYINTFCSLYDSPKAQPD